MDQKMDETFFDGHEELYHHAKFGADRTMRTSCRCENVCFFVCLSRSKSGAPCIQGVHSSNKHCVAVYCPISTLFSAFFHKGLLFQTHYLVHIPVARWPHIFLRNCGQKLRKVQKSAEKFVCTTLY